MKKALSILCVAAILLTSCGKKGGDASIADIIKDSEIAGEITVSCYDAFFYEALLNEAARGFERKFPGTKVNIEVFSKLPEIERRDLGDGSVSRIVDADDTDAKKDYIYRASTEFMTGGGADIYAADILPVYKYYDGGIFDNLREYMGNDPDFDITNYRVNIFDALTSDGRQFIMPLDYMFSFFTYNKNLFTDSEEEAISALTAASCKNLIKLAKDAYDRQPEGEYAHNYMFGRTNNYDGRMVLNDRKMFIGLFYEIGPYDGMFYWNYNDFIDTKNKKANFTDGKFAGMLNTIGKYVDIGYIESYASQTYNQDMRELTEQANSMEEYIEAFRINNDAVDYYYQLRSGMELLTIFLNQEEETGSSIPDLETNGFAGIASNGNGDVPFQYMHAFGINSNSENKKTAWEFIKYILSDDMQLTGSLTGVNDMVVNKNASGNRIKRRITSQYSLSPERIVLNDEQQKTFDDYTALLDKYAGRINTYIFLDPAVTDMVMAEVDAYFAGEKTAEEAARILQGKLTLYLSE